MDVAGSINEFPDRFGPVFVRDLRQGLRNSLFIWIFIILQVVCLVATLTELAVLQILGDSVQGPFLSGAFMLTMWITFSTVLPLCHLGTLQSELGPGRNIELLLTSQLSRWQLVRGKLLVASSLSLVTMGSILPYLLVRYFFGGLELLNALSLVGSLLIFNATGNAVVIGASAIRNYVGRIATIIFFFIWWTSALGATAALVTSRGTASFWNNSLQIASVSMISMLFLIYGLQLGRMRLRVAVSPMDQSSAIVVYILAFFSFIVLIVAQVSGGVIATLIVSGILLWLALSIDGDSKEKKRLKGLSP